MDSLDFIADPSIKGYAVEYGGNRLGTITGKAINPLYALDCKPEDGWEIVSGGWVLMYALNISAKHHPAFAGEGGRNVQYIQAPALSRDCKTLEAAKSDAKEFLHPRYLAEYAARELLALAEKRDDEAMASSRYARMEMRREYWRRMHKIAKHQRRAVSIKREMAARARIAYRHPQLGYVLAIACVVAHPKAGA